MRATSDPLHAVGHTRWSPRSEVADGVTDAMRPLLAVGIHDLAAFGRFAAGYSLAVPVVSAGYFATIRYGVAPVLSLAVAATPEDEPVVWSGLESLYLRVTDMQHMRAADFAAPRKPTALPWSAVALHMAAPIPDWAGDFERCLAWAWIERNRRPLAANPD